MVRRRAWPRGSQTVTRYTVRGATDVGRKRDHNEDSFLVDENLRISSGRRSGMEWPRRRRHRLPAGGGDAAGHSAGPARRLTSTRLSGAHRRSRPSLLPDDLLRNAVEASCQAIFRRAQGVPALNGMGTTLTALLLNDRSAFVAHVGDSRLYLIRKGHILQISDDHSLRQRAAESWRHHARRRPKQPLKETSSPAPVGFEGGGAGRRYPGTRDREGRHLRHLLRRSDEPGGRFRDRRDGQHGSRFKYLPLRLIGLANDRGGD